jgi:hypothetical protein
VSIEEQNNHEIITNCCQNSRQRARHRNARRFFLRVG